MCMPTLHHRACHLCEAICGIVIETEGERILSQFIELAEAA